MPNQRTLLSTVARWGTCRQAKKPFHRQSALQPRTTHRVKSVIGEDEDVHYLNNIAAKPSQPSVDLALEGNQFEWSWTLVLLFH